ncbi:MAG: hypothetical protein RIG84_17385 [Roseovarius sp.]
MIIALVQIPLGELSQPNREVISRYLESTKIFHEVEGLCRKSYLCGEGGGGGLYEFESRAAAEAWFNEGWADWMEGRFGVRPSLMLFEAPVVLDNAAGEVRVNGAAVPAPWEEAAD